MHESDICRTFCQDCSDMTSSTRPREVMKSMQNLLGVAEDHASDSDSDDDLGLGLGSNEYSKAARNRKKAAMYPSSSWDSSDDSDNDSDSSTSSIMMNPAAALPSRSKMDPIIPGYNHQLGSKFAGARPSASADEASVLTNGYASSDSGEDTLRRYNPTAMSSSASNTGDVRASTIAVLNAAQIAKAALQQSDDYLRENSSDEDDDSKQETHPSIAQTQKRRKIAPSLRKGEAVAKPRAPRLSWAPNVAIHDTLRDDDEDAINDTFRDDNEDAIDDTLRDDDEDAANSIGEEEHPFIQQMKDGKTEVLKNAILHIDGEGCQVLVLSVIDSSKYSYEVQRNAINNTKRWEDGGEKETRVLSPFGDKWSVIGNKSLRGRIKFETVTYVPGAVRANGCRQGSSTAAAKKRSITTKKAKYVMKKPTAVKQNRTTYSKTPIKGSKRERELRLHSEYEIGTWSQSCFPHHTPNSRLRMVKDALGGKSNDDINGEFHYHVHF